MNNETGREQIEISSYHDRGNFNGIDIEFLKNEDFDRFELSFPQIASDSEMLKVVGVGGQKILLSEDLETSKAIFDLAVKEAGTVEKGDAEAVWEKVWDRLKDYHPTSHKKAA